MRLLNPLTIVLLALWGVQGCRHTDPVKEKPLSAPILMVCEHESVKSVMAASLFNRAAIERHLPFRAVARGVSPDSAVPPAIAAALARDGFDVEHFVPMKIAETEVESASRVILISLEPAALASGANVAVEAWLDVPAASTDYAAAKASLERHIASLLDDLENGSPN